MGAPPTTEVFNQNFFENLGWLSEDHISSVKKAHEDDYKDVVDSARFYIVVTRDRRTKCSQGWLELIDRTKEDSEDDDYGVILRVPVVTGSRKKDPAAYGGPTPPILWVITELIEERDHPHYKRGNQDMARIHPVFMDEAWPNYKNRTYKLIGKYAVPFMIHSGGIFFGSSTGCVVVLRKFWEKAKEYINKAWEANGGFIGITVNEEYEGQVSDD